jgi:hypothetical protein
MGCRKCLHLGSLCGPSSSPLGLGEQMMGLLKARVQEGY